MEVITRKWATGLSFRDTLSRVITSWGGTSQVTTRSDIFTILSIGQRMTMTPGPLSFFRTCPRRNTTARSYSRRMLRHLIIQMRKIITATATKGPMLSSFSLLLGWNHAGLAPAAFEDSYHKGRHGRPETPPAPPLP